MTGSIAMEMKCFFAVTLFVIFLWSFKLMPFVIPAILLPVLYLVTGIATDAFRGANCGAAQRTCVEISVRIVYRAIARSSGLPGGKIFPATSYPLSFLALKLIGNERYAHVGDHAFEPAIGLFTGLNALPKCTAMSTYSYSLDELQRSYAEIGVPRQNAWDHIAGVTVMHDVSGRQKQFAESQWSENLSTLSLPWGRRW